MFVLSLISSNESKIGCGSGTPINFLVNSGSALPLKSTVMQSRNSPIIFTVSGVSYPFETNALNNPFFLAATPQSRANSMNIDGSLYVYAIPCAPYFTAVFATSSGVMSIPSILRR